MNEKKTFCEECKRDIEYLIETVLMKGKLKSEEYEYTGKKAICGKILRGNAGNEPKATTVRAAEAGSEGKGRVGAFRRSEVDALRSL